MTNRSPAEANADLVTRLYQAVTSDDGAAARALLAPGITLHVPGNHPGAGDHVGVDAFWSAVDAGDLVSAVAR